MDRIVVRTNAQMDAVMEWTMGMDSTLLMLAFPEGEIEFREELSLLKFWDEGAPWVRFELWIHGRADQEYQRLVSWRTDLTEWKFEDVKVSGEGLQKAELSMLLARNEVLGKSVAKFCGLMLYATNYREEIERTKTVERRAKPGKSKSGGGRRMLTIRKYTLPDEMALGQPKRKYEKHTESFGVRGHYRRYKSGKVVWVHPYTKGTGVGRKDREFYL